MIGEEVYLEHTFLREPRVQFFEQTFYIDDILIKAPLYPRYGYGDLVHVHGIISSKEYTSSRDGSLISILVIENPEIEQVEQSNPFIVLASFVRSSVSDLFRSHLGHNASGLLLGVVFGVRDGIGESFYEDLREVGLLHVVAASGANVSLLGGFLSFVFLRLVGKYKSIALTITGVFFYALISGFDSAIVRASVMAIFVYGAYLFGRQYYSFVALLGTIYIMVFINPGVVEDIGFLLSVSSTFGIIGFKTFFDNFFGKKSFFAIDDLTTTVSATLGNFAILVLFFQRFSFVSFLVNILVLWTIPFLMILGGAAALVGFVHESLSVPFLILSIPFLTYFELLTRFFAQHSFSVEFETVPLLFVLGYYLVLFSLFLFVSKRR